MHTHKNAKLIDASRHPDYIEELDHLKNTLHSLKKFLSENPYDVDPDKYWEVYAGADETTSKVLHLQAIQNWEKYRRIQDSPYFGRINFAQDGRGEEIFYIGKRGFDLNGIQVIDWRAPVSRVFYQQLNNGHNRVSYLSVSGQISGDLFLKRHLTIEVQKLVKISDEVDWRNGPPEPQEGDVSESLLAQELYARGDPRLQDIVKTIQEHQDRIIRAPANQVLIINGVAGSGKTSIAYHRVAYLLYPDTHSNIRPQRTIVINPNRLFLSYVRDLLPDLGVKDVNQVSFDDWALEQMGLITKKNGKMVREMVIQDTALENFLDKSTTRSERGICWRRARLKGSIRFMQLLEKYMEFRRHSFNIPKEGWKYKNLGELSLTISLSAEEIQQAYQEAIDSGQVLGRQRNQLIYRLESLIKSKYERAVEIEYERLKRLSSHADHHTNLPSLAEKEVDAEAFRKRAFSALGYRDKVIRAANVQCRRDINQAWKPVVRSDYYKFLNNRQLLQNLGEGIFNKQEVDWLCSLKLDDGTIDIEDVPGLLYFYLLGRGKNVAQYDHIVVDEAQDFSPLQFALLRMYCSNGSMTISGDIAQGIYAHRGISDWSEFTGILDGEPYQLENIIKNYRATKEIVEFTNQVDQSVRKEKATIAEPFNRTGAKPKVIQAASLEMMYTLLDADIYELISKGVKNIGVIVKTPADCYKAQKHLKKNPYNVSVISTRDAEYQYEGGVVILPVSLTKGMEFEAALVINVDDTNYDPDVQYDGRLLYVAVTRALHVLNVYAVGKVSGFLETALQKAEIQEV
jgi:DNA helicase-2/ATP-dependent DNA helicase PcrA